MVALFGYPLGSALLPSKLIGRLGPCPTNRYLTTKRWPGENHVE